MIISNLFAAFGDDGKLFLHFHIELALFQTLKIFPGDLFSSPPTVPDLLT